MTERVARGKREKMTERVAGANREKDDRAYLRGQTEGKWPVHIALE
jgi:hypothetical protein